MITRDAVAHVARLARIELSDADLDAVVPRLQQIVAYVEKLDGLDLSAVPPTAHVLPLRNVMREDAAAPSLDRAKALQSAPAARDGSFEIPAVIA
jgi:aspartyl-tRNA(Asn)/glutamyl-tRNA(Gln) amidotransferase subunit C